jgi:hypothetical protein
MGGNGSTRWNYHSRKYLVEDSLILDTNRLMHEGVLQEGVHKFGGWGWWDAITGERASSLDYEVNTTNPAFLWIRLSYTFTQTRETMNYLIRLTTTRPNFGGLRWWFICPINITNRVCNLRIGKIYLPPFSLYFGCRVCNDLTYRSCQESDKRVDWLRRNPEALMEIIRNRDSADISKLFLAMKALKDRFA